MKRIALLIFLTSGVLASGFAQRSKVTTAILDYNKNNLERAQENIDIAVEHKKTATDAKAWYYRGLIYLKMAPTGGDKAAEYLNTAYNAFEKTKEYDEKEKYVDDLPKSYFNLYQEYRNVGANAMNQQEVDYEQVHKYFKRSYELSEILMENQVLPSVDTVVYFYQGFTAERMGNMEEAKKIYDELVDMSYKNEQLYLFYKNMLVKEEKFDEALAVIQKGKEVMGSNSEALMIEELNVYLAAGRQKEAVDKFEKAVTADPDNVDLMFALGTVYDLLMEDAIENKDTAAAKEYRTRLMETYQRALKIDSSHFKANYNLGVIYFNAGLEIEKQMGDLPLSAQKQYNALAEQRDKIYNEAMPYLEKAHEINPEELPVMRALKEIYLRTKNNEKFKEMNTKLKEAEGRE